MQVSESSELLQPRLLGPAVATGVETLMGGLAVQGTLTKHIREEKGPSNEIYHEIYQFMTIHRSS